MNGVCSSRLSSLSKNARSTLPVIISVILLLLLLQAPGAVAVTGDLVYCTSNAQGDPANRGGGYPAISANGRYVAFASMSTNLVPGGTTADRINVFRKDIETGIVVLCSSSAAGIEGNDDTGFEIDISSNGRYVAFCSSATNLVPGGTTPDLNNIFRKDLQTGAVALVSADAAGVEGNDNSIWPSISSNGRYVAFCSSATNLVPGGTTPDLSNIFRKDLQTGAVALVSADASGVEGNNDSGNPTVSSDGHYVSFESKANNLIPGGTSPNKTDIFRKDLQTKAVVLVSADNAGEEGNDFSCNPAINSDGRYVVFESLAGNLIPGFVGRNIFRKDLQTGEILACSADLAGERGNATSYDPSISGDGRYVSFSSKSTNLVPGGTLPSQPLGPQVQYIYRKDMHTCSTLLCSADSAGKQLDLGECANSAISYDGQFVAFEGGSNLIIQSDVFRKEIGNITYYFAEGSCRPGFETYFCIQNPTSSDADVHITYMRGDGTTDDENLVVKGRSRATVDAASTLGVGDDESHDFSTMIESLNNVDIVAERPMYFNYRSGIPGYSWTGGHVVMGVSVARENFFFAEGTTRDNDVDGKYEEWLCIQNPGQVVANVDITYMLADGSTVMKSITVDPVSRETVDVNQDVGVNQDVSVLLESDVPVVAERPMYFNYRNKWAGGHDVVGASRPPSGYGGYLFYFAEGTTRQNDLDGYFDEWLTIQNPNDHDVLVEITYFTDQGDAIDQDVIVGATSRYTIDVRQELGDNVDASVRVFSANLIIVERPMYFNYKNKWSGGHDVMGRFLPAVSSNVFYFAEGSCRPDFDSYLCILNLENTDVEVTVDYVMGDGNTQTREITVPPESRYTIAVKDELGEGNSNAYDFSCRVEGNHDFMILVERPMYFNYEGEWPGGHDTVGL